MVGIIYTASMAGGGAAPRGGRGVAGHAGCQIHGRTLRPEADAPDVVLELCPEVDAPDVVELRGRRTWCRGRGYAELRTDGLARSRTDGRRGARLRGTA